MLGRHVSSQGVRTLNHVTLQTLHISCLRLYVSRIYADALLSHRELEFSVPSLNVQASKGRKACWRVSQLLTFIVLRHGSVNISIVTRELHVACWSNAY